MQGVPLLSFRFHIIIVFSNRRQYTAETQILTMADTDVYEKKSNSSDSHSSPRQTTVNVESIQDSQISARNLTENESGSPPQTKKLWWHPIKEPGSAIQIVLAAALALGIGLGVSSATEVPEAATTLLAIPGQLWLRALTCVGELF